MSKDSGYIDSNSRPQTYYSVDRISNTTLKKIKYKPTFVSGSKQSTYSAPIRFRTEDPKDAKQGPKKRASKPYNNHIIILKKPVKVLPTSVSLLSDWSQLLKTWGSTSYKRIELMCFITFAGISLDKAENRDRQFVAHCLQGTPHNTSNNIQSSFSKKNISFSISIFPLLEQATDAYFRYVNPFNPLFTRAGFFSCPRSRFLRLCVWRAGLQYLPPSELVNELCENIKQQILLHIVPSALVFELGTLQGLAILYLGLYDSSLNKFRVSMLYYASLLVSCLGLHVISPGPLNQERLLTLFTFGYNKIMATSASKSAWCNLLPDFPLQTSAWPRKTYSNVGELYKDHPNNQQSKAFSAESFSATLDANMATLCLSAYQLKKIGVCRELNTCLKADLHKILTWGTHELQRSKIMQLPNRQLTPLASKPQIYSNSMVVNYPESNLILSHLQLVLHSRYHHVCLSASDPHHTFRLVELLELISNWSPLFKKLEMLLDATRYLLILPRDSKVERYLGIVRACFKRMETLEYSQDYGHRYRLLFDALVTRASAARTN